MPTAPTPLQGNPNVFDGRQPTLIPNFDPVFYENGALQSESPRQMKTLHPTSGATTCMVPTNNFTYVSHPGGAAAAGIIVSYYYGRTYEISTSLYNEMVTAGMPVSA